MNNKNNSLDRLARVTAYICGVPLGAIINKYRFQNTFSQKIRFARTLFQYVALELGYDRIQIGKFLGLKNLDARPLKRLQHTYDDSERIKLLVKQAYKKQIIYLAGKVSNSSYEHVIEKFAKAEEELIRNGYIVINPTSLIPEVVGWELAMRTLVPYLSYCDAICLLPDWEESEGAKIEYDLAKRLGLEIIFFKT